MVIKFKNLEEQLKKAKEVSISWSYFTLFFYVI